MTRRDLLKSTGAAAALVLAGCGGRPLAAPRTGHSATPQPLAIAGFSPPDSVRAAVVGEFKRVAPGIPLEFPETVANQYVLDAVSGQLPQEYSLLPDLKALNFDPAVLLSGLRSAGTGKTTRAGLPTRLLPTMVAYNTAAFAAAGIPKPAADWTYNDFLEVCATLQGAIKAGKLDGAGVSQVLSGTILQPTGYNAWFWEAFVLGFGGQVFENGVFVLDDGDATWGLTEFASLVRGYALPLVFGTPPPGTPLTVPYSPQAAMAFTQLSPWGFDPPAGKSGRPEVARRAYARFPRLPVQPVVLADTLMRAVHRVGKATEPVAPVIAAAARYLTWRLQPPQQSLFANVGIPPVGGDPALHAAFWPLHGMDIAPGDIFVAGWAWPTLSQMAGVDMLLQKATSDPGALSQGLHQATQTLNAALAARTAAAG